MPLKMLIKCIHVAGSVERLKSLLGSDEEQLNVTVFDFDLSDENGSRTKKNLLLASLALKNAADIDDVVAVQFDNILSVVSDHPRIQKLWADKANAAFLDKLLLKLIKVSTLQRHHMRWKGEDVPLQAKSVHPADAIKLENKEVYVRSVGCGVDPFSALMNSSCSPNIRLVNVDNKNVWVVACPIKAGEQLFRSYGEEFTSGKPTNERRQSLLKKFGFYCKCPACVNNSPPARELPILDNDFIYDCGNDLLDMQTAKEAFKKNCDYINKNYAEKFPSKETCFAMSMNVFKLNALARPADFYP